MPNPINASDLKILAKTRLDDAITLYKQERYEGAIYLCGYAVELALKYKICQKLGWNKYLPARFDNDRTFYTHKLEDLKFLSGMQEIFDAQNTALWSYWDTIAGEETGWNEQLRYDIAPQSKSDARALLRASIRLYKELTK